jgi:3-methylcrotonyl-CoA carboxylase alpha subunit
MSGHSRIIALIDGRREEFVAIGAGNTLQIFSRGKNWKVEWLDPLAVTLDGTGTHGGLLAPMPGRIIALLAAEGERLEKGAPVLILEAMKMEHKLFSPSAGHVKAFRCAVDDQVSEGAELVDFEPTEA